MENIVAFVTNDFFIFSYFQCQYDHCPLNTKRRRLTKLSLYCSQKNKRKTVHYSGGCENCSHLRKGLRPKVMTIESNTQWIWILMPIRNLLMIMNHAMGISYHL